jgi:hypothetical protein
MAAKPRGASGALARAEAGLRAHALTKPEATEHFPWGERAIKVKGKVFLFIVCRRDPAVAVDQAAPVQRGRADAAVCHSDGLRARQGRLGQRQLRGRHPAADRGAVCVDRRELPGGRARQARLHRAWSRRARDLRFQARQALRPPGPPSAPLPGPPSAPLPGPPSAPLPGPPSAPLPGPPGAPGEGQAGGADRSLEPASSLSSSPWRSSARMSS